MRSNFKAQLSHETRQRKLLRLQRAKINLKARLCHETQESKLLRLAKMRSNFKAQLSRETREKVVQISKNEIQFQGATVI